PDLLPTGDLHAHEGDAARGAQADFAASRAAWRQRRTPDRARRRMSTYFAMGGYAVFIWPSYALAVVLLALVFVLAARRLEAATRALEDVETPENAAGDDADRAP